MTAPILHATHRHPVPNFYLPEFIPVSLLARRNRNRGQLWDRLTARSVTYVLSPVGQAVADDSIAADWDRVDEGHPTCGLTRHGTLGYQRCTRPDDHRGAHRSQDGARY